MSAAKTRTVLAALLCCAGSAIAQTTDMFGVKVLNPVRENSGVRLADLTKRECKPFPAETWATLTDWTNGSAISKAATENKPVLIVTWADWYAPAVRGLTLARKMAEKYGKDGLVVVAVHADQGWGEAKKPKAPEGATFLLAHDSGDKFRKAMSVDADPDFYLIDRAGQLRFADVVNESVEDAVKGLLAESKDDASTLTARVATAKDKFEREGKRTTRANDAVNLAELPELPFEKPDSAAYMKAALPKMKKKSNDGDKMETIEPKDVPLTTAKWVPSKPTTDGRAYILYFWHPDLLITYQKSMQDLELLQKQYPRDLVVAGVLTSGDDFEKLKIGDLKLRRLTPTEGDEVMKDFRDRRSLTHSQILDLDGSIIRAMIDTNNLEGLDPGPLACVISSDGKARWWGGQWGSGFKAAIDRVLANDPGVLSRRKAEMEYITKQNGGSPAAAPTPAPESNAR